MNTTFQELVQNFKIKSPLVSEEQEAWTREDLHDIIDFLYEEDFEDAVEALIDFIDDEDLEDLEDELDKDVTEKMSASSKRDAAKGRRKASFKNKMRKKKKCLQKHGDTIKKSNGRKTCNVKGKLVKGMSRQDRKSMRKTRRKNKNKITS